MKNIKVYLIALISILSIYCSSSKNEIYPGESDNLPDVNGYLDEAFDKDVENQLPNDFQAESNDGLLPITYLGNKKYSISTNLFYTKARVKMIKNCYAEYELIDVNNFNNVGSFKLLNFSFKDSEQ